MTNLEFAMDHTTYYGTGKYPEVIPLDFGLGLHLETKPNIYSQIHYRYNENERTVRLCISSFRGMCGDAIHYYGKLKADGVDIIEEVEENGEVKKHYIGGYICKEFSNLENKSNYEMIYEIELLRPVTKEDIEKDPNRWEGYEIGQKTNAFESIGEIVAVAKKVVKARFPGWKFEIEK